MHRAQRHVVAHRRCAITKQPEQVRQDLLDGTSGCFVVAGVLEHLQCAVVVLNGLLGGIDRVRGLPRCGQGASRAGGLHKGSGAVQVMCNTGCIGAR